MLGDDGAQREAIDVVNLPRLEWRARVGDLVAGRENGETGFGVDRDVDDAEGGERPDAARIEDVAGAEHDLAADDIGALFADVLPRIHRREDVDVAVGRAFGFFHHHHRVGALGHRRAGGDLHGFARVRRAFAGICPV